jgi:hypothetical protein
MICRSSSAFILAMTCPPFPALWCSTSRSIISRNRCRMLIGATSSFLNFGWWTKPVSMLKSWATSWAMSVSAVNSPRSV